MTLAPYTTANREFFERRRGPSKDTWLDWIRRGVVRGKVIDGKPFVDLNHFAVSEELKPEAGSDTRVTGRDLLTTTRAA